MKVINFFAGPGAGKSTIAAGLFYYMKKLGENVELVTEYYKELVWENIHQFSTDYLYILANQNRRLERLRDRVDYIITDSPLLLTGYYGKIYGKHPEIIVPLCEKIFNTYNNINFFVERTKPYSTNGRREDKQYAIKIDIELKTYIPQYTSIIDDDKIVDSCFDLIKSGLI